MRRADFLARAGLYAAAALTGLAARPALADDAARERQIGQQVYANLRGKGLVLDESPYYGILHKVGTRIAAAARPLSWHMNFVILRGNQANAFSAPAGNVYVDEGLMRSVENDDELANVLGHETAHLKLGHVSAKLKTQQHMNVFSRVAQMFAKTTNSQKAVGAAGVVAQYGFLNFTRTQEYAADQTGAMLAAQAGYNPWGAVWFFEVVERLYGDTGFEQYVQQHPSTHDRIDRITSYLRQNPRRFGRFSPRLTDTDGVEESQRDDRLVMH